MSLIRKISKEPNFLNLVSNFSNSLFGIGSFALLTRSFPIDIFGQWVLYITAGNFIDMFRFGITNTAVVRYLSGVDENERIKFIGSNALIGLIATIVLSVIILLSYFIFYQPIVSLGYEIFFLWYPLASFTNLPFNTAVVVLQADQRFAKLLWIKGLNSGGFFILLLANYLFFQLSLIQVVWVQIVINIITSGICMVNGWDGIRHVLNASTEATKKILHFGKYTTFTIVGTNLLRSADTIIISLSPLGTAAVALYSIPMKLTELQQIPLRSFAATAFPKMSKSSIQGKVNEVKGIFYSYSGSITILFIVISFFVFLFAEFFVLLLGGEQYLGTDPITGFNATVIVRIFCIYGLLLPIDRITGIALDSINRPDMNLIKVVYMVVTNIIGDLIAVFLFKSLEAIAIASIIFTGIGVWVGYYFLNKELNIRFRLIFKEGLHFYKTIFFKIKAMRLNQLLNH
jgi:O-antigen/teichoic acid export membrane protein